MSWWATMTGYFRGHTNASVPKILLKYFVCLTAAGCLVSRPEQSQFEGTNRGNCIWMYPNRRGAPLEKRNKHGELGLFRGEIYKKRSSRKLVRCVDIVKYSLSILPSLCNRQFEAPLPHQDRSLPPSLMHHHPSH